MLAERYRSVTWVIKASKLCNLRCSYCYEFSSLSDKSRMSPASLRKVVGTIREYSEQHNVSTKICLHGGEPMSLPLDYIDFYADLLRDPFNSTQRPALSVIQTNLFSLNQKQIDRLKNHFDVVGVSFDPFSDVRVSAGGLESNIKVLGNMERLRQNGVRFGCISVLHRQNRKNLRRSFSFFDKAGLSVRFLPFYRSDNLMQEGDFGMSSTEISDAFCELFDLWLQQSTGAAVQPIRDLISVALNRKLGRKVEKYRKRDLESVLIVDTDGSVYAIADTYDKAFRYGDIFQDNLATIMRSTGRASAIEAADARMNSMCSGCVYDDHCSGWFAAEATKVERELISDSNTHCPVAKGVIDHIYERLEHLPIQSV